MVRRPTLLNREARRGILSPDIIVFRRREATGHIGQQTYCTYIIAHGEEVAGASLRSTRRSAPLTALV